SEKDSLCLRLEPSTWHVAQAFSDFLQEFNWEKATLIVSENLPGHAEMIQHMKESAESSQRLTDSSAFKFEITRVLKFPGINKLSEVRTCPEDSRCIWRYKSILRQLYNTEERIFILYGVSSDLMLLYKAAKDTGLLHLFGNEYVWLISPPAIVSPSENIKDGFTTGLEKEHLPGLFGFYYTPDISKAAEAAAYVWYEAMRKYKGQLLNSSRLDESTVLGRLHPNFTYKHSDYRRQFWEYGKHITKLAKTAGHCYRCDDIERREYIGFNSNGVINTTQFVLVNSQIKKNQTRWFPVGSWSMSSRHESPSRTSFRIDSVIWPGYSKTPPIGRPKKYLMRVATLEEDPFITYRPLEADGRCGETSLKCRVVMSNASEFHWSNADNITKLDGSGRYQFNCCSGLSIDLLRELMKDLDFDVDLFEVPDKKWGGWTAQGWNGLVRVLLEGKADMVLTALKITPNRSEQIEFSVPYQRTGITILVALREGAISTRAFLKPYDYPSWCLILVFSVHACGAALFLFEWLSPQGLDRGNVPPREHKFSLFRSLWLIWSMLFGAAVNADNPRGVASRFLGNIWALFALVFLASYTANLAAFMIAEESYYDLSGINDWRLMEPGMHRPPFRFATVPSGATEENVKMNFPQMAEYMRNYSKSNLDEGIKALKNHEIDAFIYDATVLQYRVGKDKDCKLKTVGNWYSMTGYGVGFPKGSEWKPDIDSQILIYRKNGLLERWSKYWFTGACQQSGRLRNSNQTLGVKNFISAFILLIGGMLLCCLLLLLEHWFYRYMRPRLKDFDKYGCCGLVSIGEPAGGGGGGYLEISANSSEAELSRRLQPEQQFSTQVVPVQQHCQPSSQSSKLMPGPETALPNCHQRRRQPQPQHSHPHLHQQQQQHHHHHHQPLIDHRFPRSPNSSYQLSPVSNLERPPSSQRSNEILYKHPSIRSSPSGSALMTYSMPPPAAPPAPTDSGARDDAATEKEALVVKESVL
uniref:ANF_receptor domain-containing protein n=1 Tax=Macrostomum lignano TaxID=282301 RepID=A0A1I8GS51_9PLAT